MSPNRRVGVGLILATLLVVAAVSPGTAATRPATEADPAAVAGLERGTIAKAAIAQSVPYVQAPAIWANGHRGAGQIVVVIDTGTASTFGGTIVGQACFAATLVGQTLVGHCGVDDDETEAFSMLCFDLGVCDEADPLDEAAGRPCTSGGEGCLHGTAVAAVAARHEPTPGVAPDAEVYPIRVFKPDGTGADLVDVYLALDHVLQLSIAGLEIASVNLSIATSTLFIGECDTSQATGSLGPAYRDMFAALAARGIATTVATGNDGVDGAMGFPACISTGVAVGASDLQDDLADFSNVGAGIDLLAPGARQGNGALTQLTIPSAGDTQWAGTSFSAPHVAGAYALLAQEYPNASPSQRTWFLRAAGVPIATAAGNVPSLRFRQAVDVLPAGVLFPGSASVAGTERAAIGDLDADGRADVVAHEPGTGDDRLAFGRSTWGFDVEPKVIDGDYVPLVGNFRGALDSPDDIIWYAAGSASDVLWVNAADRSHTSAPLTIGGTFQPKVGDFDGDGWNDVFWYAPGSAADRVWYGGMSGFTSVVVNVNGTYRVAVGDVNGDGRDDIFFHGPGSATDSLWRGQVDRSFLGSTMSMGGTYTLVEGDFDGDDFDDVVLYQPGAAPDYLWRGGAAVGTVSGGTGGFTQLGLTVTQSFTPVVGDLDEDGFEDIVWYQAGSATDVVWFGRPGGAHVSRTIVVNGTYQPLVANVDGGAGDDIVWFGAGLSAPVWWSYTGAP